jgi:hypothetical protein
MRVTILRVLHESFMSFVVANENNSVGDVTAINNHKQSHYCADTSTNNR